MNQQSVRLARCVCESLVLQDWKVEQAGKHIRLMNVVFMPTV